MSIADALMKFASYLTADGRQFFPSSKLCRLCADTGGPFLNIYGTEANEIKMNGKIGILPMQINQNDSLPHNICYLCSAKLTEFNDFVERCLKTHTALCRIIGKSTSTDTIEPSYNSLDDLKATVRDVRIVLHRLEDDPAIRILPAAPVAPVAPVDTDSEVDVVGDDKDDDYVADYHAYNSSDEYDAAKNFTDKYTRLKVAGFESVYTCKGCDSVMVEPQLAKHTCPETNFKAKAVKPRPDAYVPRPASKKSVAKKSSAKRKPSLTSISKSKHVRMDAGASKSIFKRKRPSSVRNSSKARVVSLNGGVGLSNPPPKRPEFIPYSCFTEKAVSEHLARLKIKLNFVLTPPVPN